MRPGVDGRLFVLGEKKDISVPVRAELGTESKTEVDGTEPAEVRPSKCNEALSLMEPASVPSVSLEALVFSDIRARGETVCFRTHDDVRGSVGRGGGSSVGSAVRLAGGLRFWPRRW